MVGLPLTGLKEGRVEHLLQLVLREAGRARAVCEEPEQQRHLVS